VAYRKQGELVLPAHHFEIVDTRSENGNMVSQIRILNGNKPNDLLKELLPVSELVSFKELLPSMNDIFIGEVNRRDKK